MHRKPKSDLLPVDSELERTLGGLRKVSRAEKGTMADERIDQTVEQETTAESPPIQDVMEDSGGLSSKQNTQQSDNLL